MKAKEAVQTAVDYLRDLFESDVKEMPRDGDFRLEEIKHTDEGAWQITISFVRRKAEEPKRKEKPSKFKSVQVMRETERPQTVVIGIDFDREYKLVELSREGEIKSVTVRTFPVSAA